MHSSLLLLNLNFECSFFLLSDPFLHFCLHMFTGTQILVFVLIRVGIFFPSKPMVHNFFQLVT